jgi:MSHA biogenesis protein MshN
MSVINQMLRDLDRRHAVAGADGEAPPKHVRTVSGARAGGHEWFWRIVGVLMLVALGWTGWVAYQLRPREPVVTDLAFKAAADKKAAPKVAAVPKPAPPPAPKPEPVVQAQTPAPATVPAPEAKGSERLKLADVIQSPITERSAPAPAAPAAKPAPAKPPVGEAKKAAPTLVPAQGKVERRDRITTPRELAERDFRRAAQLLKQGRANEAEDTFALALSQDAAHRGARQALVAIELERGRLDAARRLLQDGLAIDPAQPDFALMLARILVERGDMSAALTSLDRSAAAAGTSADFHLLRGTILQRLARHREAADAYRAAIGAQAATPQAWIGLGISLEALQQRNEAADAFRHALAAGPISDELKSFAEQRVRALR